MSSQHFWLERQLIFQLWVHVAAQPLDFQDAMPEIVDALVMLIFGMG